MQEIGKLVNTAKTKKTLTLVSLELLAKAAA